jgi:hypothetical protein
MILPALLYTVVHSSQKSQKHHRGICGVFFVDKCPPWRYNNLVPRTYGKAAAKADRFFVFIREKEKRL